MVLGGRGSRGDLPLYVLGHLHLQGRKPGLRAREARVGCKTKPTLRPRTAGFLSPPRVVFERPRRRGLLRPGLRAKLAKRPRMCYNVCARDERGKTFEQRARASRQFTARGSRGKKQNRRRDIREAIRAQSVPRRLKSAETISNQSYVITIFPGRGKRGRALQDATHSARYLQTATFSQLHSATFERGVTLPSK